MEQGIENCLCNEFLKCKQKMKKFYLFLFFFISITKLPALSQTSGNNIRSSTLSDSSQLYVQEIINSKIPVLAEFWAVWCGPCKLLTPIINQIKDEYKGKIKVIKINIDRNRSLATYFRVVSIPSVFIIKDKIVVQRILGVQPKEAYLTAINNVLVKDSYSTDSTDSTDSKEE